MMIESQVDDAQLRAELVASKAAPAPALTQEQVVDQIVHRARSGAGVDFDVLEALIGGNDLVEINYLERGLMAARAVCRINVPAALGDGGAWGSGFLVGPRLLLTNNHVIPDRDAAQRATAEFGYELSGEGRLRRTTRFRLTPQDGFIYSPANALDYTLVAIDEVDEDGLTPISDLGYLRLDPKINKTEVGQYVTIIQHPDAKTKRIALRENKVVKLGDAIDPVRDNFLWYSSDTAPGSSGAPVTNDAWQVVCLHHAGVPVREIQDGVEYWQLVDGQLAPAAAAIRLPAEKVRWVANEGVRVSKLVADVERQTLDPNMAPIRPLITAFIADATGRQPFPGTIAGQSLIGPPIIGGAAPSPVTLALGVVAEAARKPAMHRRPTNYFDGRGGYVADFLPVTVPLPKLGPNAVRHGEAAKPAGSSDDVLRYLHFSLVFNADPQRKMAFFTAVNIDGARWDNLTRGNDTWYYDPRLPEELQSGDELYGNEPGPSKNYFDRGHLVRRLDPVWGTTLEAAQANDDTFYWTNCSPQYFGFNQGSDLWQGLENFLLYNTDEEDVKASVFSGPIFREEDEPHRGVKIPQEFWKVVIVADKDEKLYSSGYIVSQKKYALDIPFEQLPIGPNSTEPGQNFQVPISRIETDTGLIFDPVVLAADVYSGPANGRTLRSLSDVQHPRR